MRAVRFFAPFALLLLAASAHAQDGGAAEAPAPTEADAGDEARRAQVYCRVGEVSITVGDIEDAINAQSPFLRARYRDPAKLREFASNMVRFELLAQEAARRDFDENPAVVRSSKQNSVQQLIRREFDERITPETIPDSDVQAHYQANHDEFTRPEMIRASHILVASRETAEGLIAELRDADARAFRAAAREHSLDTETKLRGGDLRYFARDGRPPGGRDEPVAEDLVTAAFTLTEVGAIGAEPVAVGERFSVIKLTGRRPAEERTLEQAGQGIRLRLWRERRQSAIESFVSSLRERYTPEVFADRMANIRLDPVDPTEMADPHGHGGNDDDERAPGKAPSAMEPAPSAMEPAPAPPGE